MGKREWINLQSIFKRSNIKTSFQHKRWASISYANLPCSLPTAASERHFEWLPHNLIPDALRRCILDPVTTIKWPEFRDLNVTKTKQYTEVSMEQTFSGGKFNKRTLKAKVTLCYCVAVYT